MIDISVVVPVYRAEKSLRELHQRIVQTLAGDLDASFEIIMVEDYGGDNSWEVIETISATDQRVRGVRMSRNYGQHNALLCGIRSAQGKIIITMDDDLQHPPEELPKLLAKLKENFDVVYGSPQREPHSLLRGAASRITKLALQNAMGAEAARKASALRVFRTELRDAFASYNSPFVNIDVLLTWATSKFTSVPINHEPRKFGESGYTIRKLIVHAVNMMTGFSTAPLQLASFLGFIFSLFGFCVLAYIVVRYIVAGTTAPGFPFLASIIAIFSGVQLFALGIIGEYLARIHFGSMGRPAYLVREQTECMDHKKILGI